MRTRSSKARKCPVCSTLMRKNRKTAAGTQRWRCTDCHLTATTPRPDLAQATTFTAFQAYVLGRRSRAELDRTDTGHSLRRRFQWCWNVPIPKPPVTGVIHDQVFLDGKHVSYNWMLLTAVDQDGYVTNWQWGTNESALAYQMLLKPLPPPTRTNPIRHRHHHRRRTLGQKRMDGTLVTLTTRRPKHHVLTPSSQHLRNNGARLAQSWITVRV